MKVDIWSDVVCPWCYIGKRRFESALAQFEHRDDVEVKWHSFELDPSAPALREGDPAERLAEKYGMSRQQAADNQQRLTDMAAREGLEFHFETAKSGNTFNAHRLIHLADKHGLQDDAKERLMRAYFTEAEPIGDLETLVRLAGTVGISEDEARGALTSDAYTDDVRADEQAAAELGINGVPFFVIDRRYGVSGAQSPEVLLQAMEQAWTESHPARVLIPVGGGASDATCTDETCAI